MRLPATIQPAGTVMARSISLNRSGFDLDVRSAMSPHRPWLMAPCAAAPSLRTARVTPSLPDPPGKIREGCPRHRARPPGGLFLHSCAKAQLSSAITSRHAASTQHARATHRRRLSRCRLSLTGSLSHVQAGPLQVAMPGPIRLTWPRPTRRPRLRSSRRCCRWPPSWTSHAHTSRSRHCDGRLNPPS